MKQPLLLLLFILIFGCQADDPPVTKATTTTPTTEGALPSSVGLSDLHLNAFAPYTKGPYGPIHLGVVFELDAKKEADLAIAAEHKKITTALERMFFGDYGLFKVPPFAEHREFLQMIIKRNK